MVEQAEMNDPNMAFPVNITGVERLLSASNAALRKAGLRQSVYAPDRQAALYALAMSVANAADGKQAAGVFLNLALPVLASSAEQQNILINRFSKEDEEELVQAIFGATVIVEPRKRPAVLEQIETEQEDDTDLYQDPKQQPEKHQRAAHDILSKDWWRDLFERLSGLFTHFLKLFRLKERRARLVRKRISETARQLSLSLPAVQTGDQSPQLRKDAVRAAARRPRKTNNLDIPRTINATLRQGGMFKPVWRTKLVPTEYLFLVRQLSNADLEYARIRTALEELRAQGVLLNLYPYRIDPRELTDTLSCEQTGFVSVQELYQRHPDARLIIVSEGRELVHPFTLGPLDWMENLDLWPRKSLITPMPSADWGTVESTIHYELGFSLSSSREHGFSNLHELLGSSGPVALRKQKRRTKITPVFVASPDMQFIDEHPPPEPEQTALLSELRLHLGHAGFKWLGVCAFFPAMTPAIALYFGRQLFEDSEQEKDLSDTFARLSGLPWMRFGHMPYWLRHLIIASFDDDEQKEARKIAASILDASNLTAEKPAQLATGLASGLGNKTLTLAIRVDMDGQGGGLEIDDLAIEMLSEGNRKDIDPVYDLTPERLGELVEKKEMLEQSEKREPLNREGSKKKLQPSRSYRKAKIAVHNYNMQGLDIVVALQKCGHDVKVIPTPAAKIFPGEVNQRKQLIEESDIVLVVGSDEMDQYFMSMMEDDLQYAGRKGILIKYREVLIEEGIDFTNWNGNLGAKPWLQLISWIDQIYAQNDKVITSDESKEPEETKQQGDEQYIYIAHTDSDHKTARSVADQLIEKGYRVWIDGPVLPWWAAAYEQVKKKLDDATAIIVIWSKKAAESGSLIVESERGNEQQKLIQIVTHNFDGEQIPIHFDYYPYIEEGDWQKIEEALAKFGVSPSINTDQPADGTPEKDKKRIKIFISYRRFDTSLSAQRIYDTLNTAFGHASIYMDDEQTPAGNDLISVIRDAINKSDVLLAIIGKDWNVIDADGNRRLDNPNDWVRHEISLALQEGVPVVPVLINNTKMPYFDDLPEELKGLTYNQAIRIEHTAFRSQMKILIKEMKILTKLTRSDITNFSSKELSEIPLNFNSLLLFSNKRFSPSRANRSWLEYILRDLKSLEYGTIGDVEEVVKKTINHVEKYAQERPNVFKYSSDYLSKCLSFGDEKFMRIHNNGELTVNKAREYQRKEKSRMHNDKRKWKKTISWLKKWIK